EWMLIAGATVIVSASAFAQNALTMKAPAGCLIDGSAWAARLPSISRGADGRRIQPRRLETLVDVLTRRSDIELRGFAMGWRRQRVRGGATAASCPDTCVALP